MLDLTVRVTGDREVARRIDVLCRALTDLRPLWERIEPDVYQMGAEQWASQGGRGGARWAPLSPGYAAWKARHYPGQPLMVCRGVLRDSLTRPGSQGQVRIIDAGRMEIGTSVEYAVYHQYGGGHLPRRQVIDVSERDVQRWTAMAEAHALDVARKAGLA